MPAFGSEMFQLALPEATSSAMPLMKVESASIVRAAEYEEWSNALAHPPDDGD
jgi:hypothetical protein